jgi:hypothetical protein
MVYNKKSFLIITTTVLIIVTEILKIFYDGIVVWLPLPLLGMLLIWSRKLHPIGWGLMIFAAYLLLFITSTMTSTYWLFNPIPEANTIETNLVGIFLGIPIFFIGIKVYQLRFWAILLSLTIPLTYIVSIIFEARRIYEQTSSYEQFIRVNIIYLFIDIVVLIYLLYIIIRYRNKIKINLTA